MLLAQGLQSGNKTLKTRPFSITGICYKKKKFIDIDLVEGTGVRENAWNFQNVI